MTEVPAPETMNNTPGQDNPSPYGGVGQRLALALALALTLWPADRIHRSTLRGFLPVGTRQPRTPSARARAALRGDHRVTGNNRVSEKYKHKLQLWAERGLIERTEEWVRILDRPALVERADMLPESVAQIIREAAEVLIAEHQATADAAQREIRRRELLALSALMRDHPGAGAGGGGTARIVAGGRAL